MSSLVCLLVWSPTPHIPYISTPNHCLLFASHAHTITTCFAVVSILCHLFLVFLPTLVLLRWQEFATRSVVVLCLTYHHGVDGGGRCSMHHALRVSHLSRSLPLTPHHNAHVNHRCRCSTTRRDAIVVAVGLATDRRDDGLVQQRISRLFALVVLGTKYLSATPL